MVIGLWGVQFGLHPYFVILSMITDRIGLPEVLLPINHKNYNLQLKLAADHAKRDPRGCLTSFESAALRSFLFKV